MLRYWPIYLGSAAIYGLYLYSDKGFSPVSGPEQHEPGYYLLEFRNLHTIVNEMPESHYQSSETGAALQKMMDVLETATAYIRDPNFSYEKREETIDNFRQLQYMQRSLAERHDFVVREEDLDVASGIIAIILNHYGRIRSLLIDSGLLDTSTFEFL